MTIWRHPVLTACMTVLYLLLAAQVVFILVVPAVWGMFWVLALLLDAWWFYLLIGVAVGGYIPWRITTDNAAPQVYWNKQINRIL